MVPDDETRRELDRLWARVDAMDANGTRGIAIVQSQLSEVIKDLAKLEGRIEVHDQVHVQESRDRVSGRRWMASTAIAVLVLLVAIIGLLLGQHGT